MRFVPYVVSAFVVAAVVVACADSSTSDGTPILDAGRSDAKGQTGTSGGTSSGDACVKQTCESVEGACGPHDDGCGGNFSCGACADPKDACAPSTCTSLSRTCGTFDDGCGGTVGCGACPVTPGCAADAKEPNDKSEGASKLGKASDYDNATLTVNALQAGDGDEDWYSIIVADEGFGGNPVITATVTDTVLEVSVFHVCDSQPDYSYCNGPGTQENTIGKGCFALGTVSLNTDCKGIDEAGTSYVRVRKRGTDGTCHSYDLTVKVE